MSENVSVLVGAHLANAKVQDLVDIAKKVPIVFYIDGRGATLNVIATAPAPAVEPPTLEELENQCPSCGEQLDARGKCSNPPCDMYVAPRIPNPRKRRGKKPGPKPKPKRGGRPAGVAGKIDQLLKKGMAPVAIAEQLGVKPQKVYNRKYWLAHGPKSTASRPASIPRRMKAAPAAPKKNPIVAPPAAAPMRISKETAQVRAIAERIEADGAHEPGLATSAVCPHCNETLAASRYGGLRCRNSGCDLFNEDVHSTRASRDDCNCVVCVHARTLEAADFGTTEGAVGETQSA